MTSFAMHQPNYLPWLGWFDKLAKADVFVLLDAVQYPRGRSFASRNRILTAQGPQWLTMPASVPAGRKGKAAYTEIAIADAGAPARHLKTLRMAYARAPHTEEMLGLYEQALEAAGDGMLCTLNVALIEQVAGYLGIDTPIVRLGELLDEFGQQSQLIVDIGRELGADTYLSGDGGGHDYNDEQLLGEAGIALAYQGFEHPTYEQPGSGEFEPGMCVLDLVACCGSESARVLGITQRA